MQGCRQPPGAVSGKVSVFPASLPRLIPLRSADSAPVWGEGTTEHNGPELSQVRGEGQARAGPRETRTTPVAPERPRLCPSISEVERAGTRGGPLAL